MKEAVGSADGSSVGGGVILIVGAIVAWGGGELVGGCVGNHVGEVVPVGFEDGYIDGGGVTADVTFKSTTTSSNRIINATICMASTQNNNFKPQKQVTAGTSCGKYTILKGDESSV